MSSQSDTKIIQIFIIKTMAEKPHKRQFVVWHRVMARVQKRKFNPPVRGLKPTLQEQNRPLLLKLEAALANK